MLELHDTTEAEMREISGWKYAGDCAVYNLPPFEEQVRTGRGFANPKNRFRSCTDGGLLVGYFNLVEEAAAVRFGVGVRPDLCGRGYGQAICRLACGLSRRLCPGKPVYLEVRTWNIRAIRCYEKAGFRVVGEPFQRTTPTGEGTFFRMAAG